MCADQEDQLFFSCAEALITESFGRGFRIANYQVAKRLADYLVLIVRIDNLAQESDPQVVVLKLAGPNAPRRSSFERTQRIHQLISTETDIPVGWVFAAEDHPTRWPFRYLLMTYLEGRTWAEVIGNLTPEETTAAYRQIGETVAKLHTISIEFFGELTGGEVSPNYLPALQNHAKEIISNPRLQNFFLKVLDENAELFTHVQIPSLCHEDLHAYNLLFQHHSGNWALSGILDFDKTWAGQAESDLARIDFWRWMANSEFWTGYHSIRQEDPLYREQRPIYQLLWCLEYAQPTAEHIANTQQLCRQLRLPVIDTFD